MKDNITRRVVFGFVWRYLERIGAQSVAFVLQIVLARLLEPDTFGIIALVTVFITILNVFVDSGFANALIQKKEPDDIDFSTVFYFNIVLCISLYFLVFITAPFIAFFYHDDSITPIIRVLASTIVISGFKNVQQAYVSKHLLFKKFFYSTLGGTIGAAVVGITMAYHGFGVWALVTQQIFNVFVDTVILWMTVGWRPKRVFSFGRLKQLFDYGWKMLGSALLDAIYREIRQLIIGRRYSAESLAYYNRGNVFPSGIINNIDASINSVLLPTMAAEQDDVIRVRNMTRRAIKTSTYMIAPIMMGIAFSGDVLVRLILTDKWLPCVQFLRIFCITYMFYPIHTSNLNAIKAMGHSDIFLKLELVKKIIGITVLLITFRISVEAMAYSLLFTSVTSQIVNSYPNKKLLNYSYLEQLRDILPNIFTAVFMGICVYCVRYLPFGLPAVFVIQIACGFVTYIAVSILSRNESFEYVRDMIRKLKVSRS